VSSTPGQVVTNYYNWMGDSLWTGKPSQYRANHQSHLSLPSSGGGKSSTGLHGWGWAGRVHLCRVAGNSVWSHMAGDAP